MIPVQARSVDEPQSFILRKGLEILDKEYYDERENSLKLRINTNDQYADGRGTYLYAEIHYTKTAVPNSGYTAYDMNYLYCNSSGSTLSAYSIVYGQIGMSPSFVPVQQNRTVNISTTTKSFETDIDWVPVVDGQGIYKRSVGVTQTYTCRGWTNTWEFHVL